MTGRIILGDRGGQKGLWISRPGRSVTSSFTGDFLVDGSVEQSRPYMVGSFNSMPYIGQTTDPTYGTPASAFQLNISHGLGYLPFIWMWKDFDGAGGYGPQMDVFIPPHYRVIYDGSTIYAQGWIGWWPGRSGPWTGNFGLGYTMRYVVFRNKISP
jgi:hypothetical protein